MLFRLLNRYRQSILTKKLAKIYDDRYIRHGDTAAAVGWRSYSRQKVRFAALVDHLDLKDKSVLDVGCGTGDLLLYLQDQYPVIDYVGCDISPQMVQAAQDKYQDHQFMRQDYMELTGLNVDYVILSGVLSHVQNWPYYSLKKSLKHCLQLANQGVVFNLLSSNSPRAHQVKKEFTYFKPEKVVSLCSCLTQRYHISHNYLENDFTVTLYK